MGTAYRDFKTCLENLSCDLYYVSQFIEDVKTEDQEAVCAEMLGVFAKHAPYCLKNMAEHLKETEKPKLTERELYPEIYDIFKVV